MKIRKVESWRESVPLSRPYAIAGREMTTGVDLFFLRLVAEDGSQGLGCASPAEDITGALKRHRYPKRSLVSWDACRRQHAL